MQNDLIPFLIGVGLLVGYLCFSAATEMGTKLPWEQGSKGAREQGSKGAREQGSGEAESRK